MLLPRRVRRSASGSALLGSGLQASANSCYFAIEPALGSSAGGPQMKNVSGAWGAFWVNVLGVVLTVSMAGCALDAASTGEPGKQPVDGEVATST